LPCNYSFIVVAEFLTIEGRFITHTPRVLTPNLDGLIPCRKTRETVRVKQAWMGAETAYRASVGLGRQLPVQKFTLPGM
jgi:hypothetical protein